MNELSTFFQIMIVIIRVGTNNIFFEFFLSVTNLRIECTLHELSMNS